MIVKNDKGFITNSEYPNLDWTNGGNYVVDETTKEGKVLAEKISENYPYYDLVVSNGKLTDVTVYPSITLTSDKTTIKADGIDTATLSSAVACDWFYNNENLLDSNVATIQITATTAGTITIQAKADKYKPATISIEVI